MLENRDKKLILSALAHTWILDLDGTMVKHNGYKQDGRDTFLHGAEQFLKSIPQEDMIIFLTSRSKEYAQMTEKFLLEHGVRFDAVLYQVPYGERIVINDKKPSGLKTAVARNVDRDADVNLEFHIRKSL